MSTLLRFILISLVISSSVFFGLSLMPLGLVQAKKIYVVNQGSNNVSVINETTNKVIATIAVGINPSSIEEVYPPSRGAQPAPPLATPEAGVSPAPILPRQR